MNYAKVFFCCWLALVTGNAWAAHLVGGEFQITHKGNLRYDINLHVYGDAAGLVVGNGTTTGNQDSYVAVSTFSKRTNQLVETMQLNLSSTGFVPYTNPKCTSGSISTKILNYYTNREMSPGLYNDPMGYYIVWERCCRNGAISNIFDPGETGLVYYAEFPAVVNNNQPFINSSPVLPPMPPDYLCVNSLFRYSMKAYDEDGDRLVYSLSQPLSGYSSSTDPRPSIPRSAPYRPVSWKGGYDQFVQIRGNPNLAIDPQTGMLSVKPLAAGLYVFAFKVEEYRNNIKIGEVRRDIQVKVNNCVINQPPTLSLRPPGATQDYKEGDTLLVTDATDYCYDIKFSDRDLGQSVQLKAEPVNFAVAPTITPASGTVVQAGQTFTGKICWPDCNINSPTQLFKVNIIAIDNACGGSGTDTLQLTFRVIPKPNAKPKIVLQAPQNTLQVTVDKPFSFTILSTDADNDQLIVSMTGQNFDPIGEGMSLQPVSGQGNLISRFTWTANCTHLRRVAPYDLQFMVKDNSCFADHSDTILVRLQVNDIPKDTVEFLPPNIFTPNNDGANDAFVMPTLPKDNCEDTFQEIRIFSRWGTQVYRSATRQFAWDGRNVSDGVYFYHIRYGKKQYKGYVSILR